jgi:UDP-N-acetylglucosamine 4-epimerase
MRILVTGGAGFIGSNLVEKLLNDERVSHVRVLDNLATGSLKNLESFSNHSRFEFIEGDIRSYDACLSACDSIDLVTPRLRDLFLALLQILTSNEVNITGTVNIYTAAKEKKIKRVVHAASSSTYGDHPGLPKVEDQIGNPLSPYAVTKYVMELYASVYASLYNMQFIGLRYFNIFGPKQNPAGPYAAVIPLFVQGLLEHKAPKINGDGSHSRDFTYVDNAASANILALFTDDPAAVNQVYNIACGHQTSLLELFNYLKEEAGSDLQPEHGPDRLGDVKHSLADISKARKLLGYDPSISIDEGLKRTFRWYRENV